MDFFKIIVQNKKINNSNGFGLTENIFSSALLVSLVTFSAYFISLRQKTIFNANLTNALNDEISRDIEVLKSELKTYKILNNESSNSYRIKNTFENCNEDILSTLKQLKSWYPEEWIPGSDKLSRDGQIRNKIFKGSKVKIKRLAKSGNPLLINHNEFQVDESIVNIQYLVKFNNSNDNWKIWTNVILANELKSYCPPL